MEKATAKLVYSENLTLPSYFYSCHQHSQRKVEGQGLLLNWIAKIWVENKITHVTPRECTKKGIGTQESLYHQLIFVAFLKFLEVSRRRAELRAGKCHKQECA